MNQLDRFDWAILNELQMDGRLTNAELAQRVGLSAAPCWRRVRALEESGYITGYHATLDRHKLGLGVLAFVRVDAAQNTADITLRMEEPFACCPRSPPATTSAARAPSSCRSWPGIWRAFPVCAQCAAAPAQRQRRAHDFLAGRSEVQQRAAAAQHADAPEPGRHTSKVKRVPLAPWAIPAISTLKSLTGMRCKLTDQ
jgi:DNA-binding Lrp family transcriptional regulator